jgi:hypothetical protein
MNIKRHIPKGTYLLVTFVGAWLEYLAKDKENGDQNF